MKIINLKIGGNKFTWSDNEGVAEASSLGFLAGVLPGERIYNDASDHGFYVERNHRDILFSYTKDIIHGKWEDAKLIGWEYLSECSKFKIKIFNDKYKYLYVYFKK